MSTRASLSLSTIYRWPVVVACIIALGLAAALAGDGVARVISWIALGFPIGLIAACLAPAFLKRSAGRVEDRSRLKAFQQ